MKSKLLQAANPRTFALVFETGDEVASTLLKFARDNQLYASHFTAIGGFRDVTLGYFNIETKEYEKIPIQEQVEVVSLAGDIASGDKGPQVHAHVVIGKRDGSAHAGHLMEAHVRPTLELILEESPAHLRRKMNPQFGIALIEV